MARLVAARSDPQTEGSHRLSDVGQRYMPGGVSGQPRYDSPYPLYISRAFGARVWDVDGNEYIDYVGSMGPAVLGLSEPRVCRAVIDAMEAEGLIVCQSHPREVALAQTFSEIIPYAEMTSFHGGGGSDPLYNAVRLARAYTGRKKILKFEGGYHGWHNELAISVRPPASLAGPASRPTAVPSSAGSLDQNTANCLIAPLNDREFIERLVDENSDDLAAIVVEPVNHSQGCLLLDDGFLALLRQLCDAHGIVLIFDEIITGFRHALEGAGAQLGVYPDLAAFGKAMANGFILAALTGKRSIMSLMAPGGPVLYSGTFNGHLLSVAAAQETIRIMRTEPVHEKLFRFGAMLSGAINEDIDRLGIPAVCTNYGSVWCLYLGVTEVHNYRDIIGFASHGSTLQDEFRRHLRRYGILLPPSPTLRAFISYAHSEDDIDRTVDATKVFLAEHRAEIMRSA